MEQEKFESWAVLEIMGHQTYAGLLSEEVIGGQSFVRIDVPAIGDDAAFTKLFGSGSIYCITPTSEEFARAVASRHKAKPVHLYMPELYPPRQLTAAEPDDVDDMRNRYDDLNADED